jgi:hypothetical protein
MIGLLCFVLAVLASPFKSKSRLEAENAVLATLDCATSNRSLRSSPWMHGAPQSGFSLLICRINARSPVSICGRPPKDRDFPRQ